MSGCDECGSSVTKRCYDGDSCEKYKCMFCHCTDGEKCEGCDENKEDFHTSCGYCADYCCDCSKCEFCEGYMEDLETFTCSRFGCSAAIDGTIQCSSCRDGVCNSCGDGVDVDDWDDGSGSWDSTIGNRD